MLRGAHRTAPLRRPFGSLRPGRTPRRCPSVTAPLLSVDDLVVEFAGSRRVPFGRRSTVSGRRPRFADRRPWRDPRAGRRVGLGQDHHRARHPRPRRAELRGDRVRRDAGRRRPSDRAWSDHPAAAGDLPESVLFPEPGVDRPSDPRRGRSPLRSTALRGGMRGSSSKWSGSMPAGSTGIRISSPGGSGNASPSPARWRSIRVSSSATSRSARSTCRRGARSSTCWRICATSSGWRTCSSPTTSRSCATSAIGSR